MKTAIIGCGLIGKKRALALNSDDILVACCDVNEAIAKKFSQEFKCKYYIDFSKMLIENEIEVLIVAVVNKYISEIVKHCLSVGKHVIAEKPLGRNYSEAVEMNSILEQYNSSNAERNIVLKTGFNHRFHPAIFSAHKLCRENKIGKILNIRARYGHGGRPGMENEWRASKDLCGGGELLDQGVHVIDLIRWFGGDITEVFSKVETKFWQMEVEDNAIAILQTVNNITALFHVSWTNWKNIFSFEVFGTDGYIKIEGLGGSYGIETLEIGIRNKDGGRPIVEVTEYPGDDISWREEWNEFKNAIIDKRIVIGSGHDGLKANQIIEALYKSNQESKIVKIPN